MSTIKAVNIQHPSSPNTNIVMDSSGNMTVAGTVSGGTPMSGMRNRLINGAFDIWQRGTSFAAPANQAYGADRFSHAWGNANRTYSRQAGFSGFTYCMRMARNSGTTDTLWTNCQQIIESVNMRDLAGQTVTISLYLRLGANYSGTVAPVLGVNFGTAADEGGQASWSPGWTGVTSTQTNCTGASTTAQRFSLTVTVPSNALEMLVWTQWQASGTAGAADYVEITGWQVESGTIATPFERRLYGQELALCQRYFQIPRIAATNQQIRGVAGYGGTATGLMPLMFPVEMRIQPTITISGASMQYYSGGGVWTAVTLGVYRYLINQTTGGGIGAEFGGTTDANGGVKLLYNPSADVYASCSAEL